MATTGTVKSVTSKPKGFVIAGTPDVPFNVEVDSDDLAVVLAAYAKGATVTVSGTSPTCTGVATP